MAAFTWQYMTKLSTQILREDVLIILENKLPVSASSFINYFRAIRNLHELCVSEELGDFYNVLHDFKVNFEFLNEEFLLPMTLKIHIILHHYSDYFEWTGIGIEVSCVAQL